MYQNTHTSYNTKIHIHAYIFRLTARGPLLGEGEEFEEGDVGGVGASLKEGWALLHAKEAAQGCVAFFGCVYIYHKFMCIRKRLFICPFKNSHIRIHTSANPSPPSATPTGPAPAACPSRPSASPPPPPVPTRQQKQQQRRKRKGKKGWMWRCCTAPGIQCWASGARGPMCVALCFLCIYVCD